MRNRRLRWKMASSSPLKHLRVKVKTVVSKEIKEAPPAKSREKTKNGFYNIMHDMPPRRSSDRAR